MSDCICYFFLLVYKTPHCQQKSEQMATNTRFLFSVAILLQVSDIFTEGAFLNATELLIAHNTYRCMLVYTKTFLPILKAHHKRVLSPGMELPFYLGIVTWRQVPRLGPTTESLSIRTVTTYRRLQVPREKILARVSPQELPSPTRGTAKSAIGLSCQETGQDRLGPQAISLP